LNTIRHHIAKYGPQFLVALLFASSSASAAEPEYTFSLVEDHESDLCAHMNTVFNQYFRHMWSDPVLNNSLDVVYSSNSEYAFPLLPSTTHDTSS
jgi:hypothetical protein